MGKWLAGIAAAVIAGLIVLWISGELRPPSQPTPPPEPPPQETPEPPPEPYDPYGSFISSVISKDDPNPLDDDRVQNAIHLTLQGRDLADAERLMAEAGWPDGFGLRLLLSRFEKHGGSEAEAQMLREKLRRIGVRVEIY